MPLSKSSSILNSTDSEAAAIAKLRGSRNTSKASAPEKRNLSPDEKEAIGGILRWGTLKGWPADQETRKALVDAVLRYCTNAAAIKACIVHFAESNEWVPTEFDIRTAAEERAWSASDMTRLSVLRKDAQNCEFCQGIGREYVKITRRNASSGASEEVDALGYCRCPYGQLLRKVAQG